MYVLFTPELRIPGVWVLDPTVHALASPLTCSVSLGRLLTSLWSLPSMKGA